MQLKNASLIISSVIPFLTTMTTGNAFAAPHSEPMTSATKLTLAAAPTPSATAAATGAAKDNLETLSDRISMKPTEEDLLKRARIFLLENEDKAALADLEKALTLNPGSEVALSLKAQLLVLNKNFVEAKHDLEKLVALQPTNEKYWIRLSDVCVQTSDDTGALRAIEEAIKLKPDQATFYGQKAAIFARRKDAPATIGALNQGLEKIPGNELLLFFRATAHEKLSGNDDAALKDLEEVMETHPDFFKAYYQHAHIKIRQNQLGAARKDYDKLLAKIEQQEQQSMQNSTDIHSSATAASPGNPTTATSPKMSPPPITSHSMDKEKARALHARARVERSQRDFEHACSDALEAHTLSPKDQIILADLANMYFADERLLLAKTYFDELIKRFPKNTAQTKLALGYVAIAEGEYATARDSFNESLKDGLEKSGQQYGQVYLALLQLLAPDAATPQETAASDTVAGTAHRTVDMTEWPLPYLSYLQGKLALPDLEKMAATNGQKTELHTFLGLQALSKHETDQARKEFAWVDENGEPDFLEYALSRNLLGKMP